MKNKSILIAIFISIILTGCARIEIYDNAELSGETTGIKFFTPKPYILVSRTKAKDKPLDINIVYLPDLENPLYAKTYSGIGSGKLSMSFSDGIMTSIGQESDTKLPELITAIGGVPGLLASAKKTLKETDLLKEQSSTLPEFGEQLITVGNDLKTFLNNSSNLDVFIDSQIASLKRIQLTIIDLGKDMMKPGASSQQEAFIESAEGLYKNLINIKSGSAELSNKEKEKWNKLAVIKTSFGEIITEFKPKPISKPSLTLYEVIINSNGTSLKEVNFSSTVE